MNAEQKIVKARVQLLLHQPFFGTLTMSLVPISKPEVGTAAVDGVHVFYNPAWIQELSLEEVEFVLGHEVLHCVLNHLKRQEGRNQNKWNIACDYATNLILVSASVGKMPKGCLYDERFSKMSAEKIYVLLPENPEGKTMDSHLIGGFDTGNEKQEESTSSEKGLEDRWKGALANAKNLLDAQEYGKLPAELRRYIDELLNPKLKWNEVLRRFVEKVVPCDYQWVPPSRRYLHQGLILPSTVKEGMTLVIAIDTSGSISKKELDQFVSEVMTILGTVKADVYIISCDAKIHSVQFFPMGTPVNFKDIELRGGGGTSFIPPFRYVIEKGVTPSVFIYITDGYGDYPDFVPPFPVIWVLTKESRKQPPFGEVVEMEVD